VLSPRLIATDGLGGSPRLVAVRGLWPIDTVAPPGGWGNVVLPPRREAERQTRPLRGALANEAKLQARGEGRLQLDGQAKATALLDQRAAGTERLGGGRLMAPMAADHEALGALRERSPRLRNDVRVSASGSADAVDLDALAILLLWEDL
jgi:hypothetical protein